MSAFKYFTKIDIVKHVKASGGLTVRVQRRRPGAITTEVEARVATSDLCLYRRRQAAHRRYKNMDGS